MAKQANTGLIFEFFPSSIKYELISQYKMVKTKIEKIFFPNELVRRLGLNIDEEAISAKIIHKKGRENLFQKCTSYILVFIPDFFKFIM